MSAILRASLLFLALGTIALPASAEEVSKEQIRNLDEQVQDIKSETLSLGAQMRALEEKLLYPSSTQVAVYVSLDPAAKFRLDSVEVQLDGKPVAEHLYTARELEALAKGGVQRIYVGNSSSGDHELQVGMRGKAPNGTNLNRSKSFKFTKDEGPRLLEVRLTDSDTRMITLKD